MHINFEHKTTLSCLEIWRDSLLVQLQNVQLDHRANRSNGGEEVVYTLNL